MGLCTLFPVALISFAVFAVTVKAAHAIVVTVPNVMFQAAAIREQVQADAA